MPVDATQVPIDSPCPIDLERDAYNAGQRRQFCDHCSKSVHILSNMTESQARRFLSDNRDANICVSYAIKSDGRIRFKSEASVVPVSALSRRVRAATLAAGVTAMMAACTPHGKPPQADVTKSEPSDNATPTRVEAHPSDVMIDGGLDGGALAVEPPPERIVEGGLGKVGVKPPAKPKPTPESSERRVRGRRKPIRHSQ